MLDLYTYYIPINMRIYRNFLGETGLQVEKSAPT